MLYFFQPYATAIVTRDYDRPSPDPISVKAGELVTPNMDVTMNTDLLGWAWCSGPVGRAGWIPTAWAQPISSTTWRMLRDFSALEHAVRTGDFAILRFAESGFVWATIGEQSAWVPDAVLELTSRRLG